MSASATADQQERLHTKEQLVQHLKEFERIGNLQPKNGEVDLLEGIRIAKSKAMKQWYIQASDLTEIRDVTKETKSTLYKLEDIIQKSEERHGVQMLYEKVFDSKEAFQVVTKAEAKDDPHFTKYKGNKRNQLFMYLQTRIQNLAKKARNAYGEDILQEVQDTYVTSKEESLIHLKATFWNDDEKDEVPQSRRNMFAIELVGQEKDLSVAKEIASALLFDKWETAKTKRTPDIPTQTQTSSKRKRASP